MTALTDGFNWKRSTTTRTSVLTCRRRSIYCLRSSARLRSCLTSRDHPTNRSALPPASSSAPCAAASTVASASAGGTIWRRTR